MSDVVLPLQVCLHWVCRQRVCEDSHGFGRVPFQRKADKGETLSQLSSLNIFNEERPNVGAGISKKRKWHHSERKWRILGSFTKRTDWQWSNHSWRISNYYKLLLSDPRTVSITGQLVYCLLLPLWLNCANTDSGKCALWFKWKDLTCSITSETIDTVRCWNKQRDTFDRVVSVTVPCPILAPQVGAKRTNRPGISTTDRGFPRARFRSRGGSFSSRARYYSGYTPPRGRGRAFRWAEAQTPHLSHRGQHCTCIHCWHWRRGRGQVAQTTMTRVWEFT